MLKLSKKIFVAIGSLEYLYNKSREDGEIKPATANEISDYLDASLDTVKQTLYDLKRNGYIVSKQGIFGGYYLVKPLDKITYENILYSLKDKTKIWRENKLENAILKSFSKISVLDILKIKEFL